MNYDFGKAVDIFKDTVTKQFWNVDGRTDISTFWHFASIHILISVVIGALGFIPVVGTILGLASLVLIPPVIGIFIRRMHDINKTWWFFLIPIYDIVLACQPGDKGANQYGDDPLGNQVEA